MTSSSTAKLYLQMAMLQMIDHGSVKFTSHLNAYITKMTDLLFVTSAVERHTFLVDHDFIAANYNTNHPDYNPPEMKTRMKNKLKELISAFIRLQDLFSEVISARASLPATTAWQFVCNSGSARTNSPSILRLPRHAIKIMPITLVRMKHRSVTIGACQH
jgi:hypothetical protein